MVKKNACVFISGNGSNLRSLINHSRNQTFPINISLVVCNKINAKGIFYAKKYSIPYLIINTKKRNFENIVLQKLKRYKISLICLAGYMKIISNYLIKNYQKNIINVHPSLLPKYKGLNTFSRILKNREKKTGCTIHYVNKELDSGSTILQKIFFINSKDDEYILKQKTQKLEYRALPEAIIRIFRNI